MPGPVALERREYYGFPGNHFWKLVPDVLKTARPTAYEDKIGLLREHGIALWDVIAACRREGAADSAIRNVRPNDLPGLLKRCPKIAVIYLNGTLAETLYKRHFGAISLPTFRLPSSSPAHASMSYEDKLKRWSVIQRYLN